MFHQFKRRFSETYRIYPDQQIGQWRVEVGTPECLFAFEPVSEWFTTEKDAQSAARLARKIIELLDRVTNEFDCELMSSNKLDIEQVGTAWEYVLNYARKTRIDENYFPPTDTGTEDNDAPF